MAGGDLEYGCHANPTWSAFEEALGALEGGRALAFSSGWLQVTTVLDLVGHDALVVAPRHSYTGTLLQLGDLEGRGRPGPTWSTSPTPTPSSAACADAALVGWSP